MTKIHPVKAGQDSSKAAWIKIDKLNTKSFTENGYFFKFSQNLLKQFHPKYMQMIEKTSKNNPSRPKIANQIDRTWFHNTPFCKQISWNWLDQGFFGTVADWFRNQTLNVSCYIWVQDFAHCFRMMSHKKMNRMKIDLTENCSYQILLLHCRIFWIISLDFPELSNLVKMAGTESRLLIFFEIFIVF